MLASRFEDGCGKIKDGAGIRYQVVAKWLREPKSHSGHKK